MGFLERSMGVLVVSGTINHNLGITLRRNMFQYLLQVDSPQSPVRQPVEGVFVPGPGGQRVTLPVDGQRGDPAQRRQRPQLPRHGHSASTECQVHCVWESGIVTSRQFWYFLTGFSGIISLVDQSEMTNISGYTLIMTVWPALDDGKLGGDVGKADVVEVQRGDALSRRPALLQSFQSS